MESHSPALTARSAAPTGAAFARPMSPDEAAHLDRLREWLQGDGTDATDAAALDARWARLLATHPPEAPAPAGVAAAIGIAVGDLLVASVHDAVWRMCPGPDGATPGVLLPERPHMPVLPVLDAHARWRVRSPEWTVDYVERAAAHLRSLRPTVPTPHPAPEAVAPAAEPAAVEETSAVEETPAQAEEWTPTFVEDTTEPETQPEQGAWTPTFVEDTTEPEAQPEQAAWTPTFVEEPTAPEAQPEQGAWTPTFVEDTTEPEAQPEQAAWTLTVMAEPTPEPAAWTPTVLEEPAEAEPAAWTPTFVAEPEPEPEPAAAEPVAWTPTFVADTAVPDTEQTAWTVAEETTETEPAAWTPTIVETPLDDVEAHHEALAAPLTGAIAVVDEPAAYVAPPEYTEPVAYVAPPEYTEPAPFTAPSGYSEPVAEPSDWPAPAPAPVADDTAAPDASVMPWDAVQPPAAAAYPTPGRGMPVVPEQTLTPEDLPFRPSERVQDLALRALELALDRAVRDVEGSAPFVLVREGYDVEVLEFPHSDEGVTQARAAARDGGYTAAAVAWTSPADAGRPYPRVVVDASSAGRPGIRVAHSFLHDEQGGHEVGGPQVVGQSAPVL